MNWEVIKISHANALPAPPIPGGWEPFGIQLVDGGCWIWLKRKKPVKHSNKKD